MKKITFIKENCVGCKSCMLACSIKNYKSFSFNQARLAIGDKESNYFVNICIQCQEKSCFFACPFGAIEDIGDGILTVNHELCIGCSLCEEACVHKGIWINHFLKKAIKCDLCKGKPACVDACTTGALFLEEL